jgi:hypothetical protein
LIATSAPSRAKAIAAAQPMPESPPVISHFWENSAAAFAVARGSGTQM